MNYDETTDLAVPVEVRLRDPYGHDNVLCAWQNDHGTVSHSYGPAAGGLSLSLANLQSKRPFPRKAVPGWQREVVEFAKAGLASVMEVR